MFLNKISRIFCLLLLLAAAFAASASSSKRQLRITLLRSSSPIDVTERTNLRSIDSFQSEPTREKRDQHVVVVQDGCTAQVSDDQIGTAINSLYFSGDNHSQHDKRHRGTDVDGFSYSKDSTVITNSFSVMPHVRGNRVDIIINQVQEKRGRANSGDIKSRLLDTTVTVPFNEWFMLSSTSAQSAESKNVTSFSTDSGFSDKGFVYIKVELQP